MEMLTISRAENVTQELKNEDSRMNLMKHFGSNETWLIVLVTQRPTLLPTKD